MEVFSVSGISGKLGRPVRSYQRTFKRKPSEPPWKEVRVTSGPGAYVSFSFNGRTYGDEILFREKQELKLDIAARAVRVRVRRSSPVIGYTIICRD